MPGGWMDFRHLCVGVGVKGVGGVGVRYRYALDESLAKGISTMVWHTSLVYIMI